MLRCAVPRAARARTAVLCCAVQVRSSKAGHVNEEAGLMALLRYGFMPQRVAVLIYWQVRQASRGHMGGGICHNSPYIPMGYVPACL